MRRVIAPPPGHDLVVTTDMVAAGVHFLPGDPPETIAQKALRVNLSDLAAKGARPIGLRARASVCRRTSTRLGSPPSPTALRGDQAAFRHPAFSAATRSPCRTGRSSPSRPSASLPKGRMVRRFWRPAGRQALCFGDDRRQRGRARAPDRRGGALGSILAEKEREPSIRRYRVPGAAGGTCAALIANSPPRRWMSPTGWSAIATRSRRVGLLGGDRGGRVPLAAGARREAG